MAVATTFDLPNFVGPLFGLTPTETPFLSMIGGLTGGMETRAKEFTWQTYDLANAAQPAILEAAVPTSAQRARSEVSNVVQIFQYGVDISYTKLAAVDQLGPSATTVLGNQPVRNEMDWQLQLKIEQAARDVEYSFLNGAYQLPTDNTTARKTRGILAAISTNAVDAGTAAPLTDTLINTLLRTMFDNGAAFRNPVIFVNSFQKQALSSIYAYAPESRNVGGVNIQMIETDFAPLGVVLDRHMPAGVLGVFDVSVCAPRFLAIPGKGHFFTEPMAKTKASDESQLYGEIGLEYGPETWHGKIVDLATS